MGKVYPNGNAVKIELSVQEILTLPSYYMRGDGKAVWVGTIGNLINRAAWWKLQDVAPAQYDRIKYARLGVDVTGTGLLTVTYHIEERNGHLQGTSRNFGRSKRSAFSNPDR